MNVEHHGKAEGIVRAPSQERVERRCDDELGGWGSVLGDKESPEDALMTRLVGNGSRRGSTWFGKAGDITKRPPVWAGVAAVLAVTGPSGRQAAKRGAVSYVAGAAAHLAVKSAVGRSRPRGASSHSRIGPITSSFPSGHCASELAFSLGAAQEVPWLIVPLYAATLAAEWSLVRSRAHYPSDIFAGAAISVVVALVAGKVWPPHRRADDPGACAAGGAMATTSRQVEAGVAAPEG